MHGKGHSHEGAELTPKVLRFDHLKLTRRDRREVRRFRAWLASAETGNAIETMTLHEADGSCCRAEPWNDTAAALGKAAGLTRRIVMINLDHRG